jgi:hypothetical protein
MIDLPADASYKVLRVPEPIRSEIVGEARTTCVGRQLEVIAPDRRVTDISSTRDVTFLALVKTRPACSAVTRV